MFTRKAAIQRLYLSASLLLTAFTAICAPVRQTLSGHVPSAASRLNLQPIGRLPATERLHLAIGLPLRDPDALTRFLQEVYDPRNANFRRFLTPTQFTQRFGPAEADYQAVANFARTNGWTVSSTDPGHMLLDVYATAEQIERVCHVKLCLYQHPTESRTFYAPDIEPSLELSIPVADIVGMDNYLLPHPAGMGAGNRRTGTAGAGSGNGGTLFGYDFRAAYAPNVDLDGSGQTLGLLEFDGYYPSDIQAYETTAGLPSVPLSNEFIDSYDGTPSENGQTVGEVSLDIEMAISMAPGLSQVIIYECGPHGFGNDVLEQAANDGTAQEISSSWFFRVNSSTTTYLQRLAAQGQSFFEASGDDKAYSGGITLLANAGPPSDNPYVTSVGGTTLTTSGPTGAWTAETTWDNYVDGTGTNGSSGGISTAFPIPSWQTNTSMSANHGSTVQRNIPDVAMAADNIWIFYNNGETYTSWGTSCAAPLWAGFTALVNQQAARYGNPQVGFLNPALYALGNSSQDSSVFHDIATGNNTNGVSPNLFSAVPGYDLCTGWGSPNGINLINALALVDPLVVLPRDGFSASGASGGSYFPDGQIFYLTNSGDTALSWSAMDPSSLLTLSATNGILAPGDVTNVTASFGSSANSLAEGFYSQSLVFSNLNLGTDQERQFTVQVGLPMLTFDDLQYIDPNSYSHSIPPGYGGLSWSNFYFFNVLTYPFTPNGYQFGAVSSPNVIRNGGDGETASIISPTPFDLLSAALTAAWSDNLVVEARGYTGSTLAYDSTNTLSATAPTVVQFNYFGVTSVNFLVSGGTYHPDYNGSGAYYAMDSVQVVTHSTIATPPTFQTAKDTTGVMALSWSAPLGQTYQIQYSTNLDSFGWANLGPLLTATNSTMTASDAMTDQERFYRLLLLP